jgi:hypothetical protein
VACLVTTGPDCRGHVGCCNIAAHALLEASQRMHCCMHCSQNHECCKSHTCVKMQRLIAGRLRQLLVRLWWRPSQLRHSRPAPTRLIYSRSVRIDSLQQLMRKDYPGLLGFKSGC